MEKLARARARPAPRRRATPARPRPAPRHPRRPRSL